MKRQMWGLIAAGGMTAVGVAAFVCQASLNRLSHQATEPMINHLVAVDDRMLTVEETVALMLHGGGKRMAPYHLYRRSNPAAKPELFRVLEVEVPGFVEFHGNGCRMLAYIGDDTDVDYFAQKLRRYSGILSGTQQNKFASILICLGIQARRGNQLAAALLGEMSSLEFWKGKVKWRPDELVTSNHLTGELEAVNLVIHAQTIAGWDGVDDLRRDVAATIDDPDRRAFFLGASKPRRVSTICR